MRTHRALGASHRIRIALAIVLVAAALLWPFVDVGPKGPTLYSFTHEHGVDAGDLFALAPLMFAIGLIVWRSPDRKGPSRPM